jgi:hypothetical protein
MALSLDDVPKRVQYITIDSEFVDGSNNSFVVNLSLESNLHLESLGSVIGCKPVEFYLTQIGSNDATNANNIAKFIDVICPDLPKMCQTLDERNGQVLMRVPLERHFSGSNAIIVRDKQWKPFQRKVNFFNPISLKQLTFQINEFQDDGEYVPLNPDAKWHMTLEIHTIDHKRKTPNKEAQILEALERLIRRIDVLNSNVKKLPEREKRDRDKKISAGYLFAAIFAAFAGFVWWVNKSGAPTALVPGIPMPMAVK